METKQLVKHPCQIIFCLSLLRTSITVEGLSEQADITSLIVSPFSIIRQTSLTFHIMNVGFEMSCTYSNTSRKCQSTILRILNHQVVEKTLRTEN